MRITREFFSLRRKDINTKSTVKCSVLPCKEGTPHLKFALGVGPSQLSGGESEGLDPDS